MNVAYLTSILKTDKLSEVVGNYDAPPIDMNLAIWAGEKAGEIATDRDNDKITILKDPVPESDDELRDKILRVIQHYAAGEANITRGRLNTQIKDPTSGKGYPWHEYICAVQHLIDEGTIVQEVIDLPEKSEWKVGKKGKKKKVIIRPAHIFAFLCLPEHGENNAEWNAKSVNEYIAATEA